MQTSALQVRPYRGTRRARRRLLILPAAALALISIGAGQLSLALFTDQETVAGTFSTGSIDLDGTAIAGLTLTTSAMMPGDAVTDDVLISNVGTAQLRYSLSSASTNVDTKALRNVLTLTVKTIDVTDAGNAVQRLRRHFGAGCRRCWVPARPGSEARLRARRPVIATSAPPRARRSASACRCHPARATPTRARQPPRPSRSTRSRRRTTRNPWH